MLDESDSGVRRAALEAMTLLPVDERSKVLGSATDRLESGDESMRHAALWALAKILRPCGGRRDLTPQGRGESATRDL